MYDLPHGDSGLNPFLIDQLGNALQHYNRDGFERGHDLQRSTLVCDGSLTRDVGGEDEVRGNLDTVPIAGQKIIPINYG